MRLGGHRSGEGGRPIGGPIVGLAVKRAWRARNGSSPVKSHVYGASMTSAMKTVHWIWTITAMGAIAVVVPTASAMVG